MRAVNVKRPPSRGQARHGSRLVATRESLPAFFLASSNRCLPFTIYSDPLQHNGCIHFLLVFSPETEIDTSRGRVKRNGRERYSHTMLFTHEVSMKESRQYFVVSKTRASVGRDVLGCDCWIWPGPASLDSNVTLTMVANHAACAHQRRLNASSITK